MLDVQRVRGDFPALARTVNGRPAAFLDGPAGSQVPRRVIDAIVGYLAHHNANTGGRFPTSLESDAILAHARERMAAFLGAGSAREIVFGQNMTTLTYALSRALGRDWGAGDEVIVTELDHQANVAPWVQAAEDRGATVRVVPFERESCTLRMDRLEAFLGPRTRLVAVGGASNAVGTINDVHRISRLARDAGALSFVDAVHLAPHAPLDVGAIGCDFLACSAYKFFGPHVGVLRGRVELLERLRPYRLPPAPDHVPDRWESGTLSHEGIAGVAAAVEWIAELGGTGTDTGEGDDAEFRARVRRGMSEIEATEAALFRHLLEGIREIPGVRVYGPPDDHPRTPTLAFTVEGLHPTNAAERLAREGIFVWDGDFYASTVVDGLGLRDAGGLLRVGLAPYNTNDEVRRLVEGVRGRRSRPPPTS